MIKLREKNAFNLADVEFAIMETDGEPSVLPRSNKQPLTPSHMHIQTQSTGLTSDVIIHGNIMEENLRAAGLDKNRLLLQLQSQNISSPDEIFYAGVDSNKTLYVSKRNSGNREYE